MAGGAAHVDLEALADLATPWALRVAVTLRVPERLEEAGGAAEVAALAGEAGCDAHALAAVLGHLAARGVLAWAEDGRILLTEAGRGLLDPVLRSMLDLDGLGGRLAGAWATLPALVRTGRPAYAEVFGRPFWEDLDAHPDLGGAFDALMAAGHAHLDHVPVPEGGWEAVTTVVDVGGGAGAVLATLLTAHPHLRGTLVDLPATVARAAPVLAGAGLAGRATAAAQSFFDPLPPGADVYLLRGVLNDWPDDDTVRILGRCAEAAAPGGRVLVRGGVRPDGGRPGLAPEAVLVGGRQSTVGELRAMAGAAGLDVVAVTEQGRGLVVELRPAPAG